MTVLRRALVAALLVLAAAPSATLASGPISAPSIVVGGQSTGYAFVPGPPAGQVTVTAIELRSAGQITVSFQADRSSGCVALGACAYHGTLMFKPAGAGVVVQRYTAGGRRHVDAMLMLDVGSEPTGPTTVASVLRDRAGLPPAVCADAVATNAGQIAGTAVSRGLVFHLTALIASARCAGPTANDLAAALPSLVIAGDSRTGNRIDLRGSRAFTTHGFTGTVTSTLVFTVGHVLTQRQKRPTDHHVSHVRLVREALAVAGAVGAVTADVRGTPMQDVCVLLDSCGLSGTVTLTPQPEPVSGYLDAIGPASMAYRTFLAALGRRPGPVPPGVALDGYAQWRDTGTMRAVVRQGAVCRDAVTLGAGSVLLVVSAGRVEALYEPAGFSLFGPAAGRARCPGPELGVTPVLASGSAPRGVLRRHAFTIVLRPVRQAADDGYAIALHGRLALTFRVGAISSQVLTVPAS